MKLSFARNAESPAAEIAALKSQLESARRRITELTLDNIQKANEIAVLQDYRGAPVEFFRPVLAPLLAIGKDMAIPAAPANSESGRPFNQAS